MKREMNLRPRGGKGKTRGASAGACAAMQLMLSMNQIQAFFVSVDLTFRFIAVRHTEQRYPR